MLIVPESQGSQLWMLQVAVHPVLQIGQDVRVSGYWEDDEFKATLLENLTTGHHIVLRDATGRPMWAGQGRGKNRSS